MRAAEIFIKIMALYIGIILIALAMTYLAGLANVFIASLVSAFFLGLLNGSGSVRAHWMGSIGDETISRGRSSGLALLAFFSFSAVYFILFLRVAMIGWLH